MNKQTIFEGRRKLLLFLRNGPCSAFGNWKMKKWRRLLTPLHHGQCRSLRNYTGPEHLPVTVALQVKMKDDDKKKVDSALDN